MNHKAEGMELVLERSVPVAGFSRELRLAEDVVRFRFSFALSGQTPSPVHIVFSPSRAAAEVKMGDMKVMHFSGITSAEQAREQWITWWRAGSRKASFLAPRRAGRYPSLAAPRRAGRYPALQTARP